MGDGSDDAAVTGVGRRRPRAGDAPPDRGASAPSGPAPADGTGLGIRRVGSAPSTEAATSMVGIPTAGRGAAAGPPTPARPMPAASPAPDEAATSMVGLPLAAPPADATGLGVRRAGERAPAERPAADATGLGVRRGGQDHGSAGATGLGQRRTPAPGGPAPAEATGLGHRRAPETPETPQASPDGTGLGRRARVTGPPSAPFVGPPSGPFTGPPSGPFVGPPSAPVATTGTGHRQHGPSAPRGSGPDGVVRFGPGMPPPSPPTPATPTWHRPPAEGAAPAAAPSRPRRRRRAPFLGGVLTLLVVAGVLAWLFLRPTTPVGVQGVTVAANPAQAGCGATVVLIGTVATDGPAGTFRYRWERSDGQITETLTQSVASGATSTDVRLQWTVTGEGTFDGSATLRILDGVPATPRAAEGTGGFTYAC